MLGLTRNVHLGAIATLEGTRDGQVWIQITCILPSAGGAGLPYKHVTIITSDSIKT